METKGVSGRSVKIPLVVGGVHVVIVLITALTLIGSQPDALYQAVWFPLAIIDLPVSLLIIAIWMLPITREIHKSMLVYSFPWSDFSNFWVPLFVFGILGTVWWFYVTKFVLYAARKRKDKRIQGRSS